MRKIPVSINIHHTLLAELYIPNCTELFFVLFFVLFFRYSRLNLYLASHLLIMISYFSFVYVYSCILILKNNIYNLTSICVFASHAGNLYSLLWFLSKKYSGIRYTDVWEENNNKI